MENVSAMRKTIKKAVLGLASATAVFFGTTAANASSFESYIGFELNNTNNAPYIILSNIVTPSFRSVAAVLTALLPAGPVPVATGPDASIQTGSISDRPIMAVPATRPVETAAIAPARKPSVKASTISGAVFDTVAFPMKRLGALKKFAPSLDEMAGGEAFDCRGSACNAAANAIKASFSRTAQSSIRDRLNAINATVNRSIQYRRDKDLYRTADRWAKPSETIARQAGDCEDFAILKMAALHAAGTSLDDMALVILYDQRREFYHAVLSVSVGDTYYILDNMRDDVLADAKLPDYLPLYSIVDGRGFFHGQRVASRKLVAGAATPIDKIAPGEGPLL